MRRLAFPYNLLRKMLSKQEGPKMHGHLPEEGQGGGQVQAMGAGIAPKLLPSPAVAPEILLPGPDPAGSSLLQRRTVSFFLYKPPAEVTWDQPGATMWDQHCFAVSLFPWRVRSQWCL